MLRGSLFFLTAGLIVLGYSQINQIQIPFETGRMMFFACLSMAGVSFLSHLLLDRIETDRLRFLKPSLKKKEEKESRPDCMKQ